MSLRVLHQKRGRRKRRRRRREGGESGCQLNGRCFTTVARGGITLVALLNRWFASTCGKNQPLPCVRGLKGHTVKGWSAIKRSAIIEFRTEKNVQLQFNCTLDSVVDSFLSPCFSAFFFSFPSSHPHFLSLFFILYERIFFRDGILSNRGDSFSRRWKERKMRERSFWKIPFRKHFRGDF